MNEIFLSSTNEANNNLTSSLSNTLMVSMLSRQTFVSLLLLNFGLDIYLMIAANDDDGLDAVDDDGG
jgi:hypothetical protein